MNQMTLAILVLNKKKLMDLWKKKSIFFMLPYREHNLLCHNLDVMHFEKKNVTIFLALC